MTTPNLTAQADVALDHMAGTLADTYARAADPMAGDMDVCLGCLGAGHNLDFPDEPCLICRARDGAQTSTITPPRLANAGSTLAPLAGVNLNILALDLGTKTGFALRRRDGSTRHGTEVFTPRKSWSEGQKWARYRAWLAGVIHDEQIHRVVYEQVIRHESKGRPLWDAAHAYGAFEAITHMVCDGFNIQAHGVNLATVKKSFTGSGRAKKEDMMLQAKARGFKVVDDNNADALGILHWAVAQERAA